jgi:LysM repeat protein
LPEVTVIPDSGQGDGGATAIPPAIVTPLEPTPIPITPIPPTPLPPTAVPRPPQVLFENYQVVQGDTLFGITTKRNTTIALMARYGIDATDLVPGNVIPLPVANPAYCPGNFPYVVQEDDTLSSIAVKCQTTVQTLKQINGFGDNFRLDVTSVICVPNPP